MNSDLAQLIAGLLKGGVAWGAEQLRAFVDGLRNHELALVGTEDTLAEAKAVSSDPSFRQYKHYINDPDLRVLARAGVLLRRWQSNPLKTKAIKDLRDRIHSRYGKLGLHVSEIIQSGILDEVVRETKADGKEVALTTFVLDAFLRASDHLCLFVKGADSPDEIGRRLVRTLRGDKPVLSVLFARGAPAKNVTADVVRTLMVNVPEYRITSKEISGSKIVILVRADLQPTLR